MKLVQTIGDPKDIDGPSYLIEVVDQLEDVQDTISQLEDWYFGEDVSDSLDKAYRSVERAKKLINEAYKLSMQIEMSF